MAAENPLQQQQSSSTTAAGSSAKPTPEDWQLYEQAKQRVGSWLDLYTPEDWYYYYTGPYAPQGTWSSYREYIDWAISRATQIAYDTSRRLAIETSKSSCPEMAWYPIDVSLEEETRKALESGAVERYEEARRMAFAKAVETGAITLESGKLQINYPQPEVSYYARFGGEEVPLPSEWEKWSEEERARWILEEARKRGAESVELGYRVKEGLFREREYSRTAPVDVRELERALSPPETKYFIKVANPRIGRP